MIDINKIKEKFEKSVFENLNKENFYLKKSVIILMILFQIIWIYSILNMMNS